MLRKVLVQDADLCQVGKVVALQRGPNDLQVLPLAVEAHPPEVVATAGRCVVC